MEKKYTILFVDDEEMILKSLKRLFRKENYSILTAESAKEGIALLQYEPAVIVSDQQMPEMVGAEFLKIVKKRLPDSIRILLTGYSNIDDTIKAINEGGIYRYISKPWDDNDLKDIINKAVEFYSVKEENKRLNALTIEQNSKLKNFNRELAVKVSERTLELQSLYNELEENTNDLVKTFINIIDMYNPEFSSHSKRVAKLSQLTAKKLNLTKEILKSVTMAALLHDIGMIGLPQKILSTPYDDLLSDEKEIYRQHSIIGETTLLFMKPFKEISLIIRAHHENFDGTGFPDNLSFSNIPIEARIIAVVDFFDDAHSLYKRTGKNIDITSSLSGKSAILFDPEVVQAFFEALKDFKREKSIEKVITISELKAGMIISRDIVSHKSIFNIMRDTTMTEALVRKVKGYYDMKFLKGSIYIWSPEFK